MSKERRRSSNLWVRSLDHFLHLQGPVRGGPGILDSNFKWTADSRFRFQNGEILDSNFKLDKIQDSKFFIFLGFKFQTTFLRFIFQTCRDSGFKFETDGIQDSDLGLQGPTYGRVNT